MLNPRIFRLLLPALAAVASLIAADAPLPAEIEFNRDIRPILSDNCFTCHGPDEKKRISGLRLDQKPGPEFDLRSVLARVSHENEALRMPPAYSGKGRLSDRQIELLERWIDQGAEYQGHWAFLPPRKAESEIADPAGWARSPIDRFVLARLEAEGLEPSPEASGEKLIRRVTLDLTGIPPTLAEIDAFLADDSADAYENLVDRLLESPRYGERMAIRWLDAARYADTNGYQTDAARDMYRWRDWVIEAFNSNMPFDRFTIEQLAGDLLPHPTMEQVIATGFNRNHRANSEGGIVPEEYRVEYIVDRVETTATVWMGLTLGCTRCHDHKYDPFTQKEFYQLSAYFNSIPEQGRVFKYGNTPPMIPAPTREQQAELARLDAKIAEAERSFEHVRRRLASKSRSFPKNADWYPERDLALHVPLEGNAEGKVGAGRPFDGKVGVEAGEEPNPNYDDRFTISAWIYAEDPNGAIVAKTDPEADDQGNGFGGWGLYLIDGKLKLLMVQRWLDDALRVATKQTIPLNEWHHVAVSYDATRFATGVQFYVDGVPVELEVDLDSINQDTKGKTPIRVGDGGGIGKAFTGRIDDARIYTRVVPAEQVAALATPETLDEIARTPADRRTRGQRAKLRLGYYEQYGPEELTAAWKTLVDARREREAFQRTFPTVMVMEETPEPRVTHRLNRGVYDMPAEVVERAVPAILPPLPEGVPNNRLGFAKWLVSDDHPLTGRVAVNRIWQMFFGRGLVKTVEDFGSQGDWPVHQDVLDWLAVDLRESGWDVKRLVKTIVMSSTYRQSSSASPGLLQRDPDNALLARGPRVRMPAEMVRDQALALSGLLVEKVGGPSVRPYQPEGLWKEMNGQRYDQDHGERLYRRSLYTFWKRTAPPPFMMNFDSAGREACVVQQTRTNTPLQALNLMNDVTYVEAARNFAGRILREGGNDRIGFAFRSATAREPSESERKLLRASLDHYRERYAAAPDEALALLSEGESKRDESLDPAEHAAYTAVASLILNMDEVMTKE